MNPLVAPGRETLFRSLDVRSLHLANRLVMSPMTRMGCPGGLPDEINRDYYAARAAGGTGLVVTEGIGVDHPTSVDHSAIPRLDGPESVAAWRVVTDAVHAAGGRIMAQLWHVGPLWGANARFDRGSRDRLMAMHPMRPSGLWGTPGVTTYSDRSIERWSPAVEPMTESDIADVIGAFARSARYALEAGFDGVTLHGGHGYLLDAFVWADTNRRTDEWGGDLAARSRFPAAVVAAVREAIGAEAPLFYRFSQHTQQDYTVLKATDPDELGVYLGALAEAGVDLFERRPGASAIRRSPTWRVTTARSPSPAGPAGSRVSRRAPWAAWGSGRPCASRSRARRPWRRTTSIRSWSAWSAASSISSPSAGCTWLIRRSPGPCGRPSHFRSSTARRMRRRSAPPPDPPRGAGHAG